MTTRLRYSEDIANCLNRNRIYLIDTIDYDSLRNRLIESDMFSSCHLEYIDAAVTRSDKVARLIDIMKRRSTLCYRKFLTCLEVIGQTFISKTLEKEGGILLQISQSINKSINQSVHSTNTSKIYSDL